MYVQKIILREFGSIYQTATYEDGEAEEEDDDEGEKEDELMILFLHSYRF